MVLAITVKEHAVPYRIHTVLTDNGIQFADLPKNRKGPARFRIPLNQPIEPELDGLGNPLMPVPGIPGFWQGHTSNGTPYYTNTPGSTRVP